LIGTVKSVAHFGELPLFSSIVFSISTLLVGNGLLVVASVPVTGSVLFISAVTGSVTSIGFDAVF